VGTAGATVQEANSTGCFDLNRRTFTTCGRYVKLCDYCIQRGVDDDVPCRSLNANQFGDMTCGSYLKSCETVCILADRDRKCVVIEGSSERRTTCKGYLPSCKEFCTPNRNLDCILYENHLLTRTTCGGYNLKSCDDCTQRDVDDYKLCRSRDFNRPGQMECRVYNLKSCDNCTDTDKIRPNIRCRDASYFSSGTTCRAYRSHWL